MKKPKIKLSLNKETIARLNAIQLNNLRGGDDVPADGQDPNGDTANGGIAFLSSINQCTGFMCCDPHHTDFCVTKQDEENRCPKAADM